MSWAQREIGALLLSVENSLRVTGQSFATSVGGKQAVELDSDFFLRVGATKGNFNDRNVVAFGS